MAPYGLAADDSASGTGGRPMAHLLEALRVVFGAAAGFAPHAASPRSPLSYRGDRGVDGHHDLCVPPRADGGLPDCSRWRGAHLYLRPRAGAWRSTVSRAPEVDL